MASLSTIEHSIVAFRYCSKQSAFRFCSNHSDCYSTNMTIIRGMFLSIEKRVKEVNLKNLLVKKVNPKNLRFLNHRIKVESRKQLLTDRVSK